MRNKTQYIFAALTLVAGLSLGMVAPAAAAPAVKPLPDLPSSVLRNTTEGHEPPAQSTKNALMTRPYTNAAPEGVNDWSCKPSARHPRPVILIHGMGMTPYTAYSALGPELKKEGFCVFAPRLPFSIQDASTFGLAIINLKLGGLVDFFESTKYAAAFVKEVLRATGAKQVDLVGYSEGGTIVNVLAHTYDTSGINTILTFGGINKGIAVPVLAEKEVLYKNGKATFIGGATEFVSLAGAQMMEGSPVMAKATENGDTVPGINYINIGSTEDEYSVMSTQNPNFQTAVPGATVTNIVLQDGCKADDSGHIALPYNTRVWALVINGLSGAKVRELPCNAVKKDTTVDRLS